MKTRAIGSVMKPLLETSKIVSVPFFLAFFLILGFCWPETRGYLIGFVINLITAVLVSYYQFQFSTAGYRVKSTAKATEEIYKAHTDEKKANTEKNHYIGQLRNKYRYSLGVIIDILVQIWEKDGREDARPRLVHYKQKKGCIYDRDGNEGKGADRWDFFNQFIRPVIEDINTYSFIGWFGWCPLCPRRIRQLSSLTKLCSQLETVVSEFDAAYGEDLVTIEKDEVKPTSKPDPEKMRETLGEVYSSLHDAWQEWLGLSCSRAS